MKKVLTGSKAKLKIGDDFIDSLRYAVGINPEEDAVVIMKKARLAVANILQCHHKAGYFRLQGKRLGCWMHSDEVKIPGVYSNTPINVLGKFDPVEIF